MKGDTLAKGGVKAQFPPAGANVSQEAWDAMFEGFDPEQYLRNSDAEAPRNVGVDSGEDKPNS